MTQGLLIGKLLIGGLGVRVVLREAVREDLERRLSSGNFIRTGPDPGHGKSIPCSRSWFLERFLEGFLERSFDHNCLVLAPSSTRPCPNLFERRLPDNKLSYAGIVRGPLNYKLIICIHLALFSKMLIQIRLNKDYIHMCVCVCMYVCIYIYIYIYI